jgi:hypothetical protein
MSPDLDPAMHWISSLDYGRDTEGRSVCRPIPLNGEILRIREALDAEGVVRGTDPDEVRIISIRRALIMASVLKECSARLRLVAGEGVAAGSPELAEVAEGLAEFLQNRTYLSE